MEKTPIPRKPRIFYGYRIVVVAFWCVFLYAGCGVSTFSLFVKPLQSDFGWGRGQIMVAFTILFVLIGVASPFVGGLIDRYGARGVMSVGAFIGGLGFVLLNLTQNLWYFYCGYIVAGIGIAAIGPVPASAVVSNWFTKRRGTAIGIMSIGVGAGSLIMAPLVGGYLIPNFGWRASYLASALIMWLMVPLALLVVRTKPADMGLYPDDIEVPEGTSVTEASLSAPEGLGLKTALGTSALWLLAVSFFINGFSAIGVSQNQVPHLQDIGYSLATAANTLIAVGLGSAIGKFAFGWLCDQIQAKYANAISLGLLAVATIIFMSLRPGSPLTLVWLYAVILGLGAGGWLPTLSMLISENFGITSYGAIFGMIILVQHIGGATGPLFAGYMYDTMNTYRWAFIVLLASYAVAIPAVLAVRRSKFP